MRVEDGENDGVGNWEEWVVPQDIWLLFRRDGVMSGVVLGLTW